MKNTKLNFYKLYPTIGSDKTITYTDKLVCAYLYTIFALKKPIYSKDSYIAEQLNISKSTVATSIKHLDKYIVDNRRNESQQIEMINSNVIEKAFFKISIDSLEYNTNAFGKLLIAVINHLKGNCTKHNGTIMGELGIPKKRTLQYKIEELKNKGIVEIEMWCGNKRRTLFLSKIVHAQSKIVHPSVQNSSPSESKIVHPQIQNSSPSIEESVKENIEESIKKSIEEKESTKENLDLDSLLIFKEEELSMEGGSLRNQLGRNANVIEKRTGNFFNEFIAEGKICVIESGMTYKLFNVAKQEETKIQLYKKQFNPVGQTPKGVFNVLNAKEAV